jgi:hypothetical protein
MHMHVFTIIIFAYNLQTTFNSIVFFCNLFLSFLTRPQTPLFFTFFYFHFHQSIYILNRSIVFFLTILIYAYVHLSIFQSTMYLLLLLFLFLVHAHQYFPPDAGWCWRLCVIYRLLRRKKPTRIVCRLRLFRLGYRWRPT